MTSEQTAVALRVLTAINQRQKPGAADVHYLRSHFSMHRDLALDELACMVVQEGVRRGVEARLSKKEA